MITLLFIIVCILVVTLIVIPLVGGLIEGIALLIGVLGVGGHEGFLSLKSKRLMSKFEQLGELTGREDTEIIQFVGKPQKIEYCRIEDTKEQGYLYHWIAKKYHIVLLFDSDNKCLGVENEIVT